MRAGSWAGGGTGGDGAGGGGDLGFDEALLRRGDLDIIDICTPPDMHLRQAVAALEAGRHVILEKPLVASLAEVDALEAAVAGAGGC